MSANSPAIALLIFVVMTIFTLWFGQLMLRAVDILYKPSVKKWMLRNLQNKPSWQVPSADDESCSAEEPLSKSCMKPLSLDEKIQIQLKVLEDLKSLKGFSDDIPYKTETSQTIEQDTTSLWKDLSDDYFCISPYYFPKQLHFCLEPD